MLSTASLDDNSVLILACSNKYFLLLYRAY